MTPTLHSISPALDYQVPGERRKQQQPSSLLGGTYEVRCPLGSGSMGTVFEAKHVHLCRLVAVKVLACSDAASRQQFEHEARVHSQLCHPHIVQVFDYGIDGEVPYLVMELLRGETLRARLSRCGVLPVSDAVQVVRALASALAHTHRFGVLHRDLKPENVFLAEGLEQPFCAKLLDFGVCSSRDTCEEESGVRGTPRYMSPEQVQGRSAQIDPRSDQFSLAVVAYELITGQHPFNADRPWATMQRIVAGEFSPACSKHSSLPERVDEVFARALSKDSARRFESVNDFATAFTEALLSSKVAERDDSPLTLRSAPPPCSKSQLRRPLRDVTPPRDSLRDVLRSLTVLRQSLALGGLDAAVERAEQALAARGEDTEVEALLSLTRNWLERAFEASLGGPTALYAAVQAARHAAQDAQDALCAELLSTGARVEQTPELFALSRLDALRVLHRLRSRGVICARHLTHSAA